MKTTWTWSLLFGLAVGLTLGVVVSPWIRRPPALKGTGLLREFSFARIASEAGSTNWQVIEDRTYEPIPALARSPGIARRIVARAELSDAELARFVAQFQSAASAALAAQGVRNTGQFDLTQDSTQVIEGKPIQHRLDLPRRYYAIGDVHGVADIGYVAESGRVTVIVSLIEGR
jgi:hypothetical protein